KDALFIQSSQSENILLTCTPIAQHVELRHLLSLLELLRHVTNHIEAVEIRQKYKQTLPENLKNELIDICAHMDVQILLKALREFMHQLTEDFISDSISLKEALECVIVEYGEIEKELKEYSWFNSHFPKKILVKHAFEVYNILQFVNQKR